MEIINKILAIVMFPLSILIILEQMQVFTIELPFDKLLIGAILMVVLQVLSLLFSSVSQNQTRIINVITFIVFTLPAVAYLLNMFLTIPFAIHIPFALGIMMLAESVYALH